MFTLLKMLYKLRALIGPPAKDSAPFSPASWASVLATRTAVVDDDRVPFNEPFRSFLSLDRDKSLWLGRPVDQRNHK